MSKNPSYGKQPNNQPKKQTNNQSNKQTNNQPKKQTNNQLNNQPKKPNIDIQQQSPKLIVSYVNTESMVKLSIQLENIQWNNKNLMSMLDAQRKINEYMFEKNFWVPQEVRDMLRKLQNDITEFHTSTCDVCGNKQSRSTHMNIEHITMKTSWGYESYYDGTSHSLTLCCDCYDKHIFEGPLREFIKIQRYM